MSIFESNLAALKSRFPELADRIESFPAKDSVVVFKARDGSTCYGIRDGNNVAPIMDHVAPLARIQSQLDAAAKQISDFTRPVLIVGLYPGNEVLGIFDQCESNTSPHAPQQICVCVDSTIALYAFLKTWDATRVIDSPRVRLFWHEDMPQFVEHLRTHPEIPHIFTLITGANEETLNQVMPPLVQLVSDRDRETERLKAENNAYYNSISDQQLAERISGRADRQPRLMMPTCSWSTVIQYSTRDTCAAFEKMGWKTRQLRMDAMLTPYYLVNSINEFKPDMLFFIDHLRTEAVDIYPRNMMFVTWIQDAMPQINSRAAAQIWNKVVTSSSENTGKTRKRDLIVGHIHEVRTYGYRETRLHPLGMIVDTETFKPRVLTQQQIAECSCDVCFASNRSKPTDLIVKENLEPTLAQYGFDEKLLFFVHDHLWEHYRRGGTLTNYTKLETALHTLPGFRQRYEPLDPDDRDRVIQHLFWTLNDAIYRFLVLEWCDELGLNLHLYGKGWDTHPRFRRYAYGEIAHGKELSIVYQAADFCLHLNSTEGVHQRLREIIASGATPLTRCSNKRSIIAPDLASAFRNILRDISSEQSPDRISGVNNVQHTDYDKHLTEKQKKAITDWLFSQALTLTAQSRELTREQFEHQLMEQLDQRLVLAVDWIPSNWNSLHFNTKEELACIVAKA